MRRTIILLLLFSLVTAASCRPGSGRKTYYIIYNGTQEITTDTIEASNDTEAVIKAFERSHVLNHAMDNLKNGHFELNHITGYKVKDEHFGTVKYVLSDSLKAALKFELDQSNRQADSTIESISKPDTFTTL